MYISVRSYPFLRYCTANNTIDDSTLVNMLCCVAVRVHLVRVQVQQVFHDQETRRDLSRKEEQLLVQGMRLYW